MSASATPSTWQRDTKPIVELALRFGDALLASGMSANDVVVATLRIMRSYGLTSAHVDLTYTALTITAYHDDEVPLTATRVVIPQTWDYTRVRKFQQLIDRIHDGLDINEAAEQFERVRGRPRPYPTWVSTLGNAGVSAAVTMSYKSTPRLWLVTFVTCVIVDRLQRIMSKRTVPPLFQQLFSAAFITLVAACASALGNRGVGFFTTMPASAIVVGGVIMLLAGMTFVSAAQDAIDQFYVTASARIFDSLLRTAGIVVGIVVMLQITSRLGIPMRVTTNPITPGPTVFQVVSTVLVSASFAVWAYADRLTVLLAAVFALSTWIVYQVVIGSGLGRVTASFTAAMVTALLATVAARRLRIPGFTMILPGILPLLPGLALFNGLLLMVGAPPYAANPERGWTTLFTALSIAGGIAAGASFGTYLGRPFVERLRRIRERAVRIPIVFTGRPISRLGAPRGNRDDAAGVPAVRLRAGGSTRHDRRGRKKS